MSINRIYIRLRNNMIIRFSVANWMSFRERASFSMIATKGRQHQEHISKLTKYKARILPVGFLYGGNASGKSNFCKALSFMKKLVMEAKRPSGNFIPLEPFLLDNSSFEQPSYFEIEILVNEVIYEFSFSLTKQAIIEEKLVKINKTNEATLYHRQNEKIEFDPSLKEKEPFLKFAFQGTNENQLFLNNAVSQKVTDFTPIYEWFESLIFITPDSKFLPFNEFLLDEEHILSGKIKEFLPQLDTGIVELVGEEIPFEESPFPEKLKRILEEKSTESSTCIIGDEKQFWRFTKKDKKIILEELSTRHLKNDGQLVKFSLKQESDGSIRLIRLLPAFLELSLESNSKRVYVIDEIDSSLHYHLIRQLLEAYLGARLESSRCQLLATTHNLLLMDQALLRTDEMWLVERNKEGSSKLFSISDYKEAHKDKNLLKSYLMGRLGGIPRILSID